MRALVVGAGAVGQVLGLHLKAAGAHVTFAVRRPEAVHETTMFRLRRFGGPVPSTMRADALVSSLDGQQPFEVVFLAVPSDGLVSPWLVALSRGFGAATVVGLQPGLADRERLLALDVDPGQLVRGLISLVAFHTPLSLGDALQTSGFAYWFPPLSPWAFDGEAGRVDAVVSVLSRGGLPSTARPHLEREVVFFTAALLVTIRALERAGWSLRRLRQSPRLSAEATRQAIAVVEARLGARCPLLPSLARFSVLVALGATVVPWAVPFDFETYAREHFTKVARQSELLLGETLRDGKALGLDVSALEALLSRGS